MPKEIGTRKKRKIFDLTAQGFGSRKIAQLAYVTRPTAMKYMRLYKRELIEAESTIVQKMTEEPAEPHKETLKNMIKRVFFRNIITGGQK